MGRSSASANMMRSAAAIASDRKEAIEAMGAKLRRKLAQVEKMFDNTREANLRFYYNLGAAMLDVRRNPDKYDGPQSEQLLKRAMYTKKRQLDRAIQFAELFEPDQFEAIVALQHPETGFQLHWGHMTYLMTLSTKKQRADMAAKAVREMWDPSALYAAIKRRYPDRGGHGGGRPHSLPATVHMQIRQMMEVTRNFIKKRELWNGVEMNVFDNILTGPPDDLTDVDLENLQYTKQLLTTAEREAGAMRLQIEACEARVQEVLELRARAAQEMKDREAAVGKQHRAIDLNNNQRQRRAAAASA